MKGKTRSIFPYIETCANVIQGIFPALENRIQYGTPFHCGHCLLYTALQCGTIVSLCRGVVTTELDKIYLLRGRMGTGTGCAQCRRLERPVSCEEHTRRYLVILYTAPDIPVIRNRPSLRRNILSAAQEDGVNYLE